MSEYLSAYPYTRTFTDDCSVENFADNVRANKYEKMVASLVESVKENALERRKELDPYDENISDIIHETVGNSQYIIYTAYHYDIIACSDNRDAYFEEFGNVGAMNTSQLLRSIAFFALLQDVTDALNGWKPSDDDEEDTLDNDEDEQAIIEIVDELLNDHKK
jgi:hypothetical protein